jgi:hypothetical protein
MRAAAAGLFSMVKDARRRAMTAASGKAARRDERSDRF